MTPTQEHYHRVRAQTMALIRTLSPEDCQVQSMPDASPVKWHLAHTTWFFETFILQPALPDYQPFSDAYRVLFNSYYNAVGEKHPRPARGMLSRPSLADVLAYRQHVDQAIDRHWNECAVDPERSGLITLGLNHEQQHQELILTDVKHMLSRNPLRPAFDASLAATWALSGQAVEPCDWTEFEAGIVELGHAAGADGGFAFDNESPAHQVLLQPYALANRLVTQGEFLQFMQDDGYRRPELWLAAGWDAVQSAGWDAPGYWERRDGQWCHFTLSGMQAVQADAPVTHVSYFEADAFARWAGARLPREAEWEHAARTCAPPNPATHNFLERHALTPLPAPRQPGLSQMFGDAWEWTASSYEPYPGFKASAGAVGEYNGKFMCNQYVLRGGSCATPASHTRLTYRNFFPTDVRWQFSGIRLAQTCA